MELFVDDLVECHGDVRVRAMMVSCCLRFRPRTALAFIAILWVSASMTVRFVQACLWNLHSKQSLNNLFCISTLVILKKRAYGATHWCVLCRRHAFSFEKKSTVCCKKCCRTWSILTFEKIFSLRINAQLQWDACWLLRWVSSWLEWFEFWPNFLVELIAHFWVRPNFSPLAPKCARRVDLQVVKIQVQLCAKVLCALGRFCAQRSARTLRAKNLLV